MLNTLVKPNDIMEHKPRNILVSHHSQGNVLKITLKLQSYMITCFFVRQSFVLKTFQFLLIVRAISNLRFKKAFWSNYYSQLWTKTSPQYRYICFDIDSVTIPYSENRRSNLIIFWFISPIRSIEMLYKRISLSCVEVYWILKNVKYHK